MNLFPYEHVTYRTSLSADEAAQRLKQILSAETSTDREGSYIGKIIGGRFKVVRAIGQYNRNSFLPVITGTINEGVNGSTIEVRMRPVLFVILFLCVWFGGLLYACAILISEELTLHDLNIAAIAPFAMIVFGYGFVTLIFKSESRQSKDDLRKVFEQRKYDSIGTDSTLFQFT